MINFWLLVLGIILIVKGAFGAASPKHVRRIITWFLSWSDRNIRLSGVLVLAFGFMMIFWSIR